MELLQLKYFCAIVEYETMSRAAEILYVSQSTLSMSIKKLSQELGFPLFNKSGRKLLLTSEGELFYNGISAFQSQLRQLTDTCRQSFRQRGDTIRIATEAVDFTVEATQRYLSLYPDVKIEHFRGTTSDAVKLLTSGQVNFSISPTCNYPQRFTTQRLLYEPMSLMINSNHILAHRHQCSINDVCDETFILLKQGFAHRQATADMLHENGISVSKFYEVQDEETIASMVQNNFGIALVPRSIQRLHQTSTTQLLPHATFLPISDGHFCRSVYLIRDDCPMSEECLHFIRFLELYGKLIEQDGCIPSIDALELTFTDSKAAPHQKT